MAFKNSKTILTDVDDMTCWLEKRTRDIKYGKTDVTEREMPILAKVICGESIENLNSWDQGRYNEYLKKNKKRVAGLTLAATTAGTTGVAVSSIASGIGTASTIAALGTTGAASLGIAATSGLSIAGMGALAFVPALWPIGASMLLIGAGALFSKNKKSKETAPRASRLEKIFEDSQSGAQECGEKIKTNNKKIQDIISRKLKTAMDSLSVEAQRIKISIDDALNVDQNLRIMQYQEIVLKQYNTQNEIRKAFADLVEAYNTLVAENEELARRAAAYEANMRMCGCTNNYLE